MEQRRLHYIWVITNVIAYKGVIYITGLTVGKVVYHFKILGGGGGQWGFLW